MEVRIQEHQVDRADPLRRERAARRPGTWRSPSEYGFYSNVNPTVDHPRWSQARERRHRRALLAAQDTDVQRLRRPGGVAVHGNGSEEVLLSPNL